MKRRLSGLPFILILGAMSLLGVIITQSFWVRNALSIHEEQCDHRVMLAMKSISNAATGHGNGKYFLARGFRDDHADSLDLSAIDPLALDSVIMEQFCEMNITRAYVYGYLNKVDSTFLYGNYQGHEDEILSSELFVSFGASGEDNWYVLGMHFPESTRTMMSDMLLWVILSGIFTLAVILTFGFTIFSFYRQKRLSEMKTDFVNNLTHEFKTPIAAISVASEMLMNGELSADRAKCDAYAGIIFNENQRLRNMVDRVLQIATLDRGEYIIDKIGTDMHALIRERCDAFQPALNEKNGKISFELTANDPNLLVDRFHISNVVANLVDNAIKYSEDNPRIKIRTEISNDSFVLSIIDNGIGISAESQRQLFRQFFRVHTGDVHDVKGFGLGLYYVKSIVEAHGGQVDVHSEKGNGSVFEVRLPLPVPKNE